MKTIKGVKIVDDLTTNDEEPETGVVEVSGKKFFIKYLTEADNEATRKCHDCSKKRQGTYFYLTKIDQVVTLPNGNQLYLLSKEGYDYKLITKLVLKAKSKFNEHTCNECMRDNAISMMEDYHYKGGDV